TCLFFFFQAEDGIRDLYVTGVQTCALPIFGEAAGVGPVEVVVAEVVDQVALEGGQLRDERAREGGSPAFFEDRELEPFDVTVREIGRASCRERVYVSVVAGAWGSKEVRDTR